MNAIPNLRRALVKKSIASALRATLVAGLLVCGVLVAPVLGQTTSTKTKAASTKVKQQSKPVSAEPKGAMVYSCPMHPSVKSAQAGKCPKCGMALRPLED